MKIDNKVIELQYTVKGGRIRYVVGYAPHALQQCLDWVAAMEDKLKFYNIQSGVQMEAPYFRKYKIKHINGAQHIACEHH